MTNKLNKRSFTCLEKIIHEMNTSLQNLCLLPDLMTNSDVFSKNSEKDNNLHCLQESAKNLTRYINMMSAICEFENIEIRLELEEVDLVSLIDNEIKNHSHLLEKNKLKIVFNHQLAEIKIKLDKFLFQQLISNLIINAINHSEQSTIEINAKLLVISDQKHLCLQIIDRGCGIAKGELASIFNLLERGEHSVGRFAGSGIGVTISQKIVEAHGGRISVESQENTGTKFEIIIPAF